MSLEALLVATEATLRGELVPEWTLGALPSWPYFEPTLEAATEGEEGCNMFLLAPVKLLKRMRGPSDSYTAIMASPLSSRDDDINRALDRPTSKRGLAAAIKCYEYGLREAWRWLIRLSNQRMNAQAAPESPCLRASVCAGVRKEMERLTRDLRQMINSQPCPGCGKSGCGCHRSDDGRVAFCYAEDRPDESWSEGVGRGGGRHWWRRLSAVCAAPLCLNAAEPDGRLCAGPHDCGM